MRIGSSLRLSNRRVMAVVPRIILALTALSCAAHCLAGEPLPGAGPLPSRNTPPSAPGTGVRSTAPLPALPGARTPIDEFRELLAMAPAERAQALAARTEYQRKTLQEGLQAYEALTPGQRELRLTQMEFRWHLEGLMKLAATNRASRLAAVPARLRTLTEERLKEWDGLPPQMKKSVLEHETTSSYFLRPSRLPGSPGAPAPDPGPPPPPLPKAGALSERLSHFLDLPSEGERETLNALSEAERADMDDTLRQFAKLAPEQRRICIDSFEKLKRMNAAERQQFLKNAERWKAMSPGERETWRSLLHVLPPGATPTSPPPLPGTEPTRTPVTVSNTVGNR